MFTFSLHITFPFKSVAELRGRVFPAVIAVHDIDVDSAMGTSIITDDKSSCRFSDNDEVSECVCSYIVMLQMYVSEKGMEMYKSKLLAF